jgi:uncharacterized protein YcsI (UPF0317 family)
MDLANRSPRSIRKEIREGRIAGPTAGMALGFVQANLVILPESYADDFREFCRENPRPCPLLEMTSPGNWEPTETAPGADLRTDLPRYRVFRAGSLVGEPTAITDGWRPDFVAFLLGCSFTFEEDLLQAGLPVRHLVEGKNVPMYVTNRECRGVGPFQGPLVVSMRPYRKEQVDQVIEITERQPYAHGAPIQISEPEALGITDVNRPDFGDAVTIREGELPLFWACGVTPQVVIKNARPDIAITHSPGCMFITDLPCHGAL